MPYGRKVNYQWSIKKRNMEDNRDDFWKDSLIGCFSYIIGILVGLMAAVLLAGCTTTKYVPVPEVHHDTVRITQQQRDSIYLHDSIYVQTLTRGDTVYLTTDRWHTLYRDRWSHDTLYQSRTDTIAKPYPVEVEVPADLTWWQRLRIDIADIVLGLLAIAGVVWVVRLAISLRN